MTCNMLDVFFQTVVLDLQAIDLNKESLIVRYNSSLNVASLLENQFLKSICNVSFKKCSFDNAMIYIKHLSLSNPTHNDIVH
jgi:hypothetical protein